MDFYIHDGDYGFKHATDSPQTIEPETLGREHFHKSYELLYVMEGKAKFNIQGHHYNITKNNLLLIKPGEYHYMDVDKTQSYERLVLRFSDMDIPNDLSLALKSVDYVYDISNLALSNELFRIIELEGVFTYHEDIVYVMKNQLNIILTLLCKMTPKPSKGVIGSDIAKIIDFVDKKILNIKSVDDVCHNVNMSRAKVQKLMKNHFHTGLMSYVRTKQFILARDLIQNGEPATNIYQIYGFSDYSSFFRAYKKIFGVSPTGKK